MIVPDRVRLPLHFDTSALTAEVASMPAEAWIPHYNAEVYEGEWTAVALRSPAGRPDGIYADPSPEAVFVDTPVLGRYPALGAAMAEFRCPLRSARLLALAPGAVVQEHTDLRLGWSDGEIRVHIPITTAPEVQFLLDGTPLTMKAGEAWYLDFRRPHRLANHSETLRVHLVVDCEVNPWLTHLMEQALEAAPPAEPEEPEERVPIPVIGGANLIDDAELGGLGVAHVARMWSRAAASCRGQSVEWNDEDAINDRIVLHGLGLGLEPTVQYLWRTQPTLAAFEAWILDQKGGTLDPVAVRRVNALVLKQPYEPAIAEWIESIESAAPVLDHDDLAFWAEQGYVVLHDAIDPEACAAAAGVVWAELGAWPDDPDTWYPTKLNGIMVQVFQHPALEAVRRSPRIHKAYAQLWGTADLLVTTDRCGFNPPERGAWAFPGPHLHWDVPAVPPVAFGTQGLVYLTDTAVNGGAFVCAAGFHRRIDDWLASDPARQHVNPPRDEQLVGRPVPGRAGDLIIWHQALPHGSSPNRNTSPRIVEYVNLLPPYS